MSVENPDDLPQGPPGAAPAQRYDTTIFREPQSVLIEPMRRGRGGMGGVLGGIALMLIPCAALGGLAWYQTGKLEEAVDEARRAQEAEVAGLKSENIALLEAVESDERIRRLLGNEAEENREVDERLAEKAFLGTRAEYLKKLGTQRDTAEAWTDWEELLEPVDWQSAAEEVIETRINRLEDIQSEISKAERARTVSEPPRGTIE